MGPRIPSPRKSEDQEKRWEIVKMKGTVMYWMTRQVWMECDWLDIKGLLENYRTLISFFMCMSSMYVIHLHAVPRALLTASYASSTQPTSQPVRITRYQHPLLDGRRLHRWLVDMYSTTSSGHVGTHRWLPTKGHNDFIVGRSTEHGITTTRGEDDNDVRSEDGCDI